LTRDQELKQGLIQVLMHLQRLLAELELRLGSKLTQMLEPYLQRLLLLSQLCTCDLARCQGRGSGFLGPFRGHALVVSTLRMFRQEGK